MSKEAKKYVEDNIADFFQLYRAVKTFEIELMGQIENHISSKHPDLVHLDSSRKYGGKTKRSYVVTYNSKGFLADRLLCSVAYNDDIYGGKPFAWIALGFTSEAARKKFYEKSEKENDLNSYKWNESKQMFLSEMYLQEKNPAPPTLEKILSDLDKLIERAQTLK